MNETLNNIASSIGYLVMGLGVVLILVLAITGLVWAIQKRIYEFTRIQQWLIKGKRYEKLRKERKL